MELMPEQRAQMSAHELELFDLHARAEAISQRQRALAVECETHQHDPEKPGDHTDEHIDEMRALNDEAQDVAAQIAKLEAGV